MSQNKSQTSLKKLGYLVKKDEINNPQEVVEWKYGYYNTYNQSQVCKIPETKAILAARKAANTRYQRNLEWADQFEPNIPDLGISELIRKSKAYNAPNTYCRNLVAAEYLFKNSGVSEWAVDCANKTGAKDAEKLLKAKTICRIKEKYPMLFEK